MKKHRKLKITFLVIILLAAAIAAIMVPHMFIPQISDSLSVSSHTAHQPQMVAHRGLSSLAPQNSLPAVELSVEYGYDGCEFDIHTTKDGRWVVIHDDTVDAMTDGEGRVADFTFEEIRKLRLDGGNRIESYENLQIPSLEEVLEVLQGTGTAPVIEIKGCDIRYLPSLREIIERYGLQEESSIISFDKQYLEEYRKLDAGADIMLLTSVITEEDVQWCLDNKVDTVSFNYFNFYKSVKGWKAARDNRLSLAAWTVDNTVYKDVMVLLGAEKITTNKLIVNK